LIRSSLILLWLLLASSSLFSEINISFPKGGYTLREVVDRIQHETPFDIDLPFVDKALVRTKLPKTLELKESLFWISRYHEKYNQLLLHFDIEGTKVRFSESFSKTAGTSIKVLDRKIRLKGDDWTVKDALASASRQIDISIRLPMRDGAKLSSKYNYQCSLRELLDEVRIYWLEYNQQRLIYRYQDGAIVFLDGGKTPAPQSTLDIELMRNISDEGIKKESPTKPSSILPMPWEKLLEPKEKNDKVKSTRRPLPPQVMVTSSEREEVSSKKVRSLGIPLPEVKPIDHLPPSSPEPSAPAKLDQGKLLAELKKFEPLKDLGQQERMILVQDLIRPHLLPESPDILADWLSVRLPNRRGMKSWAEKIRNLDISGMNSFQKKSTLRGIQEEWLKKILARTHLRQGPKSPDQGWHRRYRLGVGAGRHPLQTSSHAVRPVDNDGLWVSQDLLLDYRFNPPGPWNYGFGLGIGMTHANEPKELSESYLSFHYQGERHVSSGSLETVAPFLDMEVVTDALSKDGLLEHQLWTAGLTLHWREKAISDGDLTSSSTFHMSKFLPIGDSRYHFFYPSADLRQDGFGYRHQWSWSHATADTAQGPHGDVYLIHNKGQHFSNDGLEYGFGFGYHYNQSLWRNSLDIGFNNWDRKPKSDSLRFEWTSRRAIGRGDGVLHLLHEIRESDHLWYDGSSTLVELSWEVNW